MIRIAVRFKNRILMPMKIKRASRFIQNKEARIRYDCKIKLHYLELLREPSGYAVQEIIIGIDPGSCFDGISIVSKDTHHDNYELIQRPKKGKNSIKTFKDRQRTNRRLRRSRLWHRRARYDNRNKSKLVPTIKANVDFRKWMIDKIVSYYPISKVVIEDVKYNHAKNKGKGASFSQVEQGKNELYRFICDKRLQLELYNGYNTKKLRISALGCDIKSMLKDDKRFEAHCVDSFVLACNKDYKVDKQSGELLMDEPIVTNELFINKKVLFIEKVVKVRRCLTRLRHCYKDAKHYYRKLKGNVRKIYSNISAKPNICRVKQDKEKSNHPKEWKYINNGFSERFKCSLAPYGGTRLNGKSFFIDGRSGYARWVNRKIDALISTS